MIRTGLSPLHEQIESSFLGNTTIGEQFKPLLEYVSVILCDSKSKALYYGNIAKGSAASSRSGQGVAIPAGLTAGSYTMYVFKK